MKGGSQGTAVAGGGIGGTGSANIGKSVVSEDQAAANTAQSTQSKQPPPKPKSGDKNKKKKKKGNKW